MLANIKILLGITDSSKDELLLVLIDQAQEFARTYIHDTCLYGLEGTISQMVIYNYNRLGTEGLNSESYSGVSYNYLDTYPEHIIKALNKKRKVKFYG